MTDYEQAERSASLLAKATALGGRRLETIVEKLIGHNVSLPMEERDAFRLRNVGSKTVSELRQLGLVKDSISSGLSVRAANCLNDAGIETKEQARRLITDGWLNPATGASIPAPYDSKRNIRGYGWVTHKEVCKWAGLPEPRKPKRVRICPHCGKPDDK